MRGMAIPSFVLQSRGENTLEITKTTTMGQMLDYDTSIADVLINAGMHCVGCPSSINESLEEACQVHGLNADSVLQSIHQYLKKKTA